MGRLSRGVLCAVVVAGGSIAWMSLAQQAERSPRVRGSVATHAAPKASWSNNGSKAARLESSCIPPPSGALPKRASIGRANAKSKPGHTD